MTDKRHLCACGERYTDECDATEDCVLLDPQILAALAAEHHPEVFEDD